MKMDAEDKKIAAAEAATRRLHEAMADSREERRLLREEQKAAKALVVGIHNLIQDQVNELIKRVVDEHMITLRLETALYTQERVAQLEAEMKKVIKDGNMVRLVAKEIVTQMNSTTFRKDRG